MQASSQANQATSLPQTHNASAEPSTGQTTTKICLSCGAVVAVREDGTVVDGPACGH